jgi:hypothetical protein
MTQKLDNFTLQSKAELEPDHRQRTRIPKAAPWNQEREQQQQQQESTLLNLKESRRESVLVANTSSLATQRKAVLSFSEFSSVRASESLAGISRENSFLGRRGESIYNKEEISISRRASLPRALSALSRESSISEPSHAKKPAEIAKRNEGNSNTVNIPRISSFAEHASKTGVERENSRKQGIDEEDSILKIAQRAVALVSADLSLESSSVSKHVRRRTNSSPMKNSLLGAENSIAEAQIIDGEESISRSAAKAAMLISRNNGIPHEISMSRAIHCRSNSIGQPILQREASLIGAAQKSAEENFLFLQSTKVKGANTDSMEAKESIFPELARATSPTEKTNPSPRKDSILHEESAGSRRTSSPTEKTNPSPRKDSILQAHSANRRTSIATGSSLTRSISPPASSASNRETGQTGITPETPCTGHKKFSPPNRRSSLSQEVSFSGSRRGTIEAEPPSFSKTQDSSGNLEDGQPILRRRMSLAQSVSQVLSEKHDEASKTGQAIHRLKKILDLKKAIILGAEFDSIVIPKQPSFHEGVHNFGANTKLEQNLLIMSDQSRYRWRDLFRVLRWGASLGNLARKNMNRLLVLINHQPYAEEYVLDSLQRDLEFSNKVGSPWLIYRLNLYYPSIRSYEQGIRSNN